MRRERRNPFRSSLVIEPAWRRWTAAALAVLVYAAAFVPLYRQGGVGASALAVFPVVILGWLFGAWGGLLAGVGSAFLNALLLSFVGEPGWAIVTGPGGMEGSALVVVVGAVIGLLRDLGLRLDRHLTEWRKAERALRSAEDRYRLLFERSRDPMYVSRPDGRIVEANDAMLRLLGEQRSDLHEIDVNALYEDPLDRERFMREVARAGFVEDFPVRLRLANGTTLDCLITASARYGAGPERPVVEYQGSLRNVSENRTLHSLAERRTHELQEVVHELESFTYSVSHDLRTHLVTMGGFASILWTEYREHLDEKGQNFLERIVTASRRMDAFVQDLLNYSRIGRMPVSEERVELSEIVATAVATLAPMAETRGARIDVAPDLPAVQGDRTLLERVVENLLSNALKFVPEDRAPEVSIRAEVEERRVRLKVRDNGVGIESVDVERAFKAFERLDPARFPGTGVGLSIVEKAVDRLGGDVGVRSVPGQGSTFWVLLPLALPAELVEDE
ncbi:MAG: PAS domain-containing sensor histidine kinase [Longimicrobiales bacterium]